jgi:hypothetical protein
MRRPLTALVGAAVLAAALIPAVAGAADNPTRRHHLRLACEVVRHEGLPAVACKWSGPDRIRAAAGDKAANPSDAVAPSDVPGGTAGPGPAAFRLWRAGRVERPHVVYRGRDHRYLDTTVRQSRRYAFRVEALDARGRTIARSNVVRVKIPTLPVRVAPEPRPVPRAEVKPVPLPEAKPAPRPEAKPVPLPEAKPAPLPEAKPAPLPEPKPELRPGPVPQPEPRPEPAPQPAMKLACRVMDEAARTTTNIRPAPAVACRWSEVVDRRVAGYRLWRAEPNTARKVVFETRTDTGYIDGNVLRGHAYVYGVQAIGPDGRVIASSEPVKVSVPGDPPDPGTDPVEPAKVDSTQS